MSTPYPGNDEWPENFEGCTLTGTYVGLDGVPVDGSLTLTGVPEVLLDFPDEVIVVPRPLEIDLDGDGHFEIMVPATDDPDISPLRWTYFVVENFTGGRRYNIEAPMGQTVDLVNAVPVPSAAGLPIVKGDKGDAGSVITVEGVPADGGGDVDLGDLILRAAQNLADLPSAEEARDNLGLGSAALMPADGFATAGQAQQISEDMAALQNAWALMTAELGVQMAALQDAYDALTTDTGWITVEPIDLAEDSWTIPAGEVAQLRRIGNRVIGRGFLKSSTFDDSGWQSAAPLPAGIPAPVGSDLVWAVSGNSALLSRAIQVTEAGFIQFTTTGATPSWYSLAEIDYTLD